MKHLDAKQVAALQDIKAAGAVGYRNWDGKRRPHHARRIIGLTNLGLIQGRLVQTADGERYNYLLTEAGSAFV